MMKYVLILLMLSLSTRSNMEKIYTFSTQTNIKEWRIANGQEEDFELLIDWIGLE